jgi:hypothetical protein
VGGAAERVVTELGGPGRAPGSATQDAVWAALIEFTDGVIAKMVPIAVLLRRAVPA